MTERYRFHGATAPAARTRPPILAAAPTADTDNGVATLRLYDPIDSWGGYWGVSAKEFVDTLDKLPDAVTEIRLHINSPGGEVFEGIAILNALRGQRAKGRRVVTIVDGLAASAASFIAMAGDEVVMGRNTELMIHKAWGICIGNADYMRELAERLDKHDTNLASIYAARAGGTTAKWLEAMRVETWYSAQEAVDAGLADRVEDAAEDSADAAKARYDLSIFTYAGRAAAPPPPAASHEPPAQPPGNPTPNPEGADSMSDTLDQGLRERLGVTAELDEAGLLAALDEALDEQTTPPPPAPVVPTAGTVVVDEAQYAALVAASEQGVAARTQQLEDQRSQLVQAAIADGRIPKARQEHWLAQLAADPGAAETLASLMPGLVPLAEIGSAAQAETTAAENEYFSLFPDEKKAV